MTNKAKSSSLQKAPAKKKTFLLSCYAPDGNINQLGKYARTRYENAKTESVKDKVGCMIAQSRKTDGYAQLKLRFNGVEAAPRTYTLEVLNHGIEMAKQATVKDFSHLCGRGHEGCINPDHIVLEDHKTNLERQKCFLKAQCPDCDKSFFVFPCNHTPPCLRQ